MMRPPPDKSIAAPLSANGTSIGQNSHAANVTGHATQNDTHQKHANCRPSQVTDSPSAFVIVAPTR